MASLHDHQGWTDRFTITPSQGLIDASLHLAWRAMPWRVIAQSHYFQSDTSVDRISGDKTSYLGSELDLEIEYNFSKNQDLSLNIASFKTQEGLAVTYKNTTRIILTHSIKF